MFPVYPAAPAHLNAIYLMMLDWAKFEGIENKIRITESQLGAFLFRDKPIHFSFVAMDGLSVVGMALFNFTEDNICVNVERGIYIEAMYVAPGYRHHGIGDALFMHILNKAKEHDCSRLEGWVSNHNTHATEFYKAHGVSALNNLTIFKLDLLATKECS